MFKEALNWLFGLKDDLEVYYMQGNEVLPKPLSKEEEEEALIAFENGDETARDCLIEHNLRLVVYIAKRYETNPIFMEDLISIGSIGLIKAVNTFKRDKNIKLVTYASRCIENEILMFLRKKSKRKVEVSFDEPLNIDYNGNELLLSDILGTDGDIVTKEIEKEENKREIMEALSTLKDIIQESPAEANKSLTITVKVVGTYNDELTFNPAGEVTQTVVLQNLPVQKGTDVIKGKFIDLKTYQNPVVNFLPSELNQVKGPDGKPAYSKQGQQFIDFLNTHNNGQLIKEEIFSNPYIGTDDTNPNDRTKIVGYRVSNYDDLSGVANIKLLYVNYYDASGKLILDKDGTGKDPYPSKNITFTGFAKASPTTVGNTYVDVKDYFKLPGLDTGSAVPEQFENLTPGQIVDDIERRVLAIEDKRQQSIEFKNNVIGIVKPLFVGAGNVEWTESQNILDSKGYLRITSDSDLITQKIIIPGKVQGQVGGGMNVGADVPPEKGSVTPVKEQQLQNTLKVKFEPGFSEDTSGTGKKQIDIRKTFIADNRLGTLSFKVSVTGFWRAIDPDGISTEIEETPDIVDATPTATADGSDPVVNQQSVTITITGLKKDVAVETQSANLIVICTSIAGGVAALILLIAFIIKLKKFGTGGY